MTSKKQEPTRRQRDALAGQRVHGDGIREWLQQRLIAATNAKAKMRRRVRHPSESRGVDRVPPRLIVIRPAPDVVESPTAQCRGVDGHVYGGNHAERRAKGWRATERPPRRRELAGYTFGKLTRPEQAIVQTEIAKAEQAGRPLTARQITARCWALINDRPPARQARQPKTARAKGWSGVLGNARRGGAQ